MCPARACVDTWHPTGVLCLRWFAPSIASVQVFFLVSLLLDSLCLTCPYPQRLNGNITQRSQPFASLLSGLQSYVTPALPLTVCRSLHLMDPVTTRYVSPLASVIAAHTSACKQRCNRASGILLCAVSSAPVTGGWCLRAVLLCANHPVQALVADQGTAHPRPLLHCLSPPTRPHNTRAPHTCPNPAIPA